MCVVQRDLIVSASIVENVKKVNENFLLLFENQLSTNK